MPRWPVASHAPCWWAARRASARRACWPSSAPAPARPRRGCRAGTCWMSARALAFAPISQALRQLVRELDPTTLERVLGAFAGELARLVPDLGPPEPSEPARGGLARGRLFAGLTPGGGAVGGRAAAGASHRGSALGRPLHPEPAGVSGGQPDRTRDGAGGHLSQRRAGSPPPAALAPGRAGPPPQVERIELGRATAPSSAPCWPAFSEPRRRRGSSTRSWPSGRQPVLRRELLAAGGSQGLSTTLNDLLGGRVEGLSDPAQQVLRVAGGGRPAGRPRAAGRCLPARGAGAAGGAA